MSKPIPDGDYILVSPSSCGISALPPGCGIRVVGGEIVDGEHGAGSVALFVSKVHLDAGFIKPMEKVMSKTPTELARDEIVARMKARMGTAKPAFEKYEEEEIVEAAPEPVAVPEKPAGNWELYSKLFRGEPDGLDFWIPVYKDEDWDEEDRAFIPDINKFNNFIINHSVCSREMRALVHGLKVLVVGPSGSGKTTLQEFICAKLRQPYLRINGRQDMESDTLLGKPWVKAGAMEFLLGELPKALQKGWFIAFDEPWKTPAGIQMALQRMYERDGILQLDDMPGTLSEKQIKPLPSSKFVLCDNVVGTGDGAGKYGATMIQDGSTLNRIDVVLKLNYLPPTQEVEMLQKMHPSLHNPTVEKMVRLGQLIRVGYEQDELSAALSPRNLDAWGMMAVAMDDTRAAFESTILGRYAEDSERAAVEEHYRNVFG